MDQAYTLTVFTDDGSPITDIIGKICEGTRTDSKYKAEPDLVKIKSLVIKKGDDEKRYKLSSPPFFIYGGLGIVFGLNDFNSTHEDSHSDIQYVLKVDCPQPGSTRFGLAMETAIRINDKFKQYADEHYYENMMAQSYGSLSNEPRTFAIYKYHGEELGNMIYGRISERLTFKNEPVVKIFLRNVISCLRSFNIKSLYHNDFCSENLVFNKDSEVVLVDLDTMTDLTKLSESKECDFRVYEDENGRNIFEICPPKPANGVGCVTYPQVWGRSLVPYMSELFKFSQVELRSFNGGYTVTRSSSNTVKTLMMADRYGLFWVIIKILFTAVGYDEDGIEGLFGIDFRDHNTYTKFYNAIKNSSYREKVIRLIKKITMIDEDTKYIRSEHFKDFIRVLLDLIKEDVSIDNIAAFDALLNHPFLRVPEKGQSQLQDPLPSTLQVQDQSPLQDQSSLQVQDQVQDQSLQPAVQANAGGSHKKKRRPARINQRTKKRNTRNKQNRQNRTKKGQSKRARK
jgi:hypothetical protein